jgi:hypothetical protein
VNYTTDYQGKPAIAEGAPASPARNRIERGPTKTVRPDDANLAGRPLEKHEREAIRVLGALTAWRFDLWMLTGNAKAACRAHVMGELLNRRATQRESGIYALREKLEALAAVPGDCIATREANFRAWAKSLMIDAE